MKNNAREEEWPDPMELPEPNLPSAPGLPAELLPPSLAPWITDISQRLCVSVEMVAGPALVALSAVVGRSMGIHPKAEDDWLVVPNLWGAVVARPGQLKTPAIEGANAPLRQLEAGGLEAYKDAHEQASTEAEGIEILIEVIKSKMRDVAKGKLKGDLAALKNELGSLKRALQETKVSEKRYLTQDPTVEKLGELLRENPRGLLLLRDELSGWLRNLDRPGREGEREFYLESWNGTGGFTFDRIGRGTIHIPALTLSVSGGIQPGRLRAYIAEALGDSRGADGLLQRFQILMWPDNVPPWDNVDRSPDIEARNLAFAIFEAIDSISPQFLGLETPENDGIPALRFDPEAQEFFDRWRDRLETRLRSSELQGRSAFESHLAKYRSLMPSLALLFHLIEVVARKVENHSRVALEHARRAANWCGFLEAHAEKVYAVEGPENAALLLADRIQEGKVKNGMTFREIYRHGWANLDTTEKLRNAIQVLEKHGWVRLQERLSGAGGGRPSPCLLINPKLEVASG